MIVTETERLRLRRLEASDAAFIRELVNEPAWLEHIGDKSVATLADARAYIASGPAAMHTRFGFGLDLVERKEDNAALGICGLLKRENLEDVDLGYAFLRRHWGQGYAIEAARGAMAHATRVLGLTRVVAITTPTNQRSMKLLEAIGFGFERTIALTPGAERRLFAYPATDAAISARLGDGSGNG